MSDVISGALTVNIGMMSADEGSLSISVNCRYPVQRSYEEFEPVLRTAFEVAGFEQKEARHNHSVYFAPDSKVVSKLLDVYTEATAPHSKT